MKEELREGTKLQHDRYEIIRLLGSSQYARVYMVKDHKMLKSRIVKEVIPPESSEDSAKCKEHFMAEAKQILPLKHPTLPRYFDYFEEESRYYIVREFVEGKNLEQLISKSAQIMPEKQFRVWAAQICDIFIYLHQQKPQIFFGGLRPENLLVTPMGKIRVMDYGIDRFYPHEQRKSITKKFAKDFLPPELLEGEEPSIQSDIYNLGALIFLLLTGQKPGTPLKFETASGEKPDFFKTFEDPIRKCLSIDKSNRYDVATEFKKDLLGAKAALSGPQMEIDEPQLNYVDIPGGRMVQGSFGIRNTGNGMLTGRVTADVPWVRVFPEYFNQNELSVEFNVHTSDLPTGASHTAVIMITTPTELKRVPIEIALHTQAPQGSSDAVQLMLLFLLPILHGIGLLIYSQFTMKIFEQALPTVTGDITTYHFPVSMLNKLYLFSAIFLSYAILCPIYTGLIFFVLRVQRQRKFVPIAMLLCLIPSGFAYFCAVTPGFSPSEMLMKNATVAHFSVNGMLLQFIGLNVFAAIYYSLRIPFSSREFTHKNPMILLFMRMILTLIFAILIILMVIDSNDMGNRIIMLLIFVVTALLLSLKAREEKTE